MYNNTRPESAPKGVTVVCFHPPPKGCYCAQRSTTYFKIHMPTRNLLKNYKVYLQSDRYIFACNVPYHNARKMVARFYKKKLG